MQSRFANSRAFTLIELLVVISIIALLVTLLLPALKRSRDVSLQTVCLSGIRGAGVSLTLYADDHDGFLPITYAVSEQWVRRIVAGRYATYQGMICPAFPPVDGVPTGQTSLLRYMTYGLGAQYNPDWAIRFADAWSPSKSEVLLDSIVVGAGIPGWVSALAGIEGPVQYFMVSKRFDPNYALRIHLRHMGKANMLFMDIHAKAADDKLEAPQYYQYPEYGMGPLGQFYAFQRD